jgi:D-alanyl-D-alanine carboxypeptidase
VRFGGAAALCLLFFVGAGVSWAYFSDASAAIPTPTAQEAAVDTPAVSSTPNAFAGVSLVARAAIVVDETTGRTLYAYHPEVQLPLASLTKVALVLAVSEVVKPDDIIDIPYDTAPPGSYQRLAKGERWYARDVIDFTLAASSNLGADILAGAANASLHARYPASPADQATLWRMNDLAKQLGLQHTYFLNDNGLDESTTQSGAYGSAQDIAKLFAYAASTTPTTFSATTLPTFTITSIDGAETSAINTDEALPAISGMIMGKTGYTDLAGGNLAVVFEDQGHEIVAVVLGSTESGRFEDMKALVSRASAAITQE